ncbi:SLAP domain-containing protein [Lactobacillus gallinarum]|uniref:SLAP domain-containing protein n=1 Tax=Lactobacillus gallinarum TaxID=52242 RepID=UPI001F26898B|nr:SLAP domain-containing protein [Lactobacillus gallinarum]
MSFRRRLQRGLHQGFKYKRTLKRNAYVYATSKRRADYTVLRKGRIITTYGGSYKFRNGKRYYQVAGATATNKRYVKVVNFK